MAVDAEVAAFPLLVPVHVSTGVALGASQILTTISESAKLVKPCVFGSVASIFYGCWISSTLEEHVSSLGAPSGLGVHTYPHVREARPSQGPGMAAGLMRQTHWQCEGLTPGKRTGIIVPTVEADESAPT